MAYPCHTPLSLGDSSSGVVEEFFCGLMQLPVPPDFHVLGNENVGDRRNEKKDTHSDYGLKIKIIKVNIFLLFRGALYLTGLNSCL
jgi:hypothetical protein